MANSSDICIAVEGVSKKFSRSLKRSFIYGARDIGRALLGRGDDNSLQKSEFWAIRDVSFELRRGQSIGVVGLNGSGKTTLMRMVSGILRPTTGKVSVHGRIAPMLALGAGFKPVLSGRENIYLNLSLLGVAPADIRARFDSIVDFAELAESIDAAIGTYSSGMLARLGFACAVHTDPQILVVDEVLSVGDTRFRIKCRNRINELRKNGTSMLLVSHSAIMIETLSDQCLYLRGGHVAAYGPPAEVMRHYQADTAQSNLRSNPSTPETRVSARHSTQITSIATAAASEHKNTTAIQTAQITNIHFGIAGAAENGIWRTSELGEVVIQIDSQTKMEKISVNLMIFDLEHQPGEVVQFMMSCKDIGWVTLDTGQSEIRLSIPAVGMRPGTYRTKLSISQGDMHDIVDAADNLKLVVRDQGKASNCLYYQPRDWYLNGTSIANSSNASGDEYVEDLEEF